MYAIFKNTLHLLLPGERKRFFLFALLDAFIILFDIALLAALLSLIDFYIHPGKTTLPFFNSFFSDRPVALIAAVLFILFAVKNTTATFIVAAEHRFVYAVASRLSLKKMRQFLNGTYRGFVETDAAVHIKQIGQQPVEFAHYVLSGWQQVLTQLALLLFTIMVIAFYKPLLFLLLLLLIIPPLVFTVYFAKRKTAGLKNSIKTDSENALQQLKEALAGFTESNVYGKNEFFSRRYAARQFKLNKGLAELQTVQALPFKLMEVFAVAGLAILITVSSYTNTAVSFFTIGALMAAAYKIIPGLAKIINHAALIKTYAYTAEDVVEDEVPGMNSRPDTVLQSVEFKNVSFGYTRQVLNAFDCCIKTGDFAGISAASGKGKTTFINLLLGFEEEEEGGSILFNDLPVTAKARRAYWKDIAYVKQQPFLIYDTIENNIVLGDEAKNAKLLTDVVEATGLNEWVAGLEKGMQTVITENGKNISGGQRQRIAIARALYKNAAVIILDETFSELDDAAEKKLLGYFKQEALSGKIVLMITHNAESLLYCNKIIRTDAQ